MEIVHASVSSSGKVLGPKCPISVLGGFHHGSRKGNMDGIRKQALLDCVAICQKLQKERSHMLHASGRPELAAQATYTASAIAQAIKAEMLR
jgi:hypothetical protein